MSFFDFDASGPQLERLVMLMPASNVAELNGGYNMQALIDSFVSVCPEASEMVKKNLRSLNSALEESIESVKSSMNIAIDQRAFGKMYECQMLRATDEAQQKLGHYVELLHQGIQHATKEPPKQPTVAAGNPERREPGQRDIAVRINGTLVNAASVKKLFEGVLGELDAKDQLELLLPLLPFATGTRSYLLA